jgi:TonB family protein
MAKELSPAIPANSAAETIDQTAVEIQNITPRSKPSPAGERPSQTVSELKLSGNNQSSNQAGIGKTENVSDREVLTERSKLATAPPSSHVPAALTERSSESAPAMEPVPLPSSESLTKLARNSPLPPLTADIAAGSAALGVPVSRGVTPGRLIRQVNPTYPSTALQQRISGPVVLQARIGKDGRVHDVKVVSGHPFLASAAVDALRQWQYQPYKLNGQPVDLQTQVTINFNLP